MQVETVNGSALPNIPGKVYVYQKVWPEQGPITHQQFMNVKADPCTTGNRFRFTLDGTLVPYLFVMMNNEGVSDWLLHTSLHCLHTILVFQASSPSRSSPSRSSPRRSTAGGAPPLFQTLEEPQVKFDPGEHSINRSRPK